MQPSNQTLTSGLPRVVAALRRRSIPDLLEEGYFAPENAEFALGHVDMVSPKRPRPGFHLGYFPAEEVNLIRWPRIVHVEIVPRFRTQPWTQSQSYGAILGRLSGLEPVG
jgi:hypothetical protein